VGRRLAPLVLAIALLALVCVPVALAAPTRAEYVAQLEPICQANTQANSRILKGARHRVKTDQLAKASKQFTRATAAFATTVDQMAAVEQPSSDLATLSDWFGRLRREVTLLRGNTTQLKHGNADRAQRLAVRLNQNSRSANDVVVGFGFNYCLVTASRFAT
jgi:hypothetical protein